MIPSRVKRKPPPAISFAERFPSPDPSDPFAPLWVLRSRASSQQDCHHSIELSQPTQATQHLSPEYHLCEVRDGDSSGTESDTTVPHVKFKAVRRPFHGRQNSQNRFARFLAREKTTLDDTTTANKADYKHVRKAFISRPVVSVVLQESKEKHLVPMCDCPVYETAGPIPECSNTYSACDSGRSRHSQSFHTSRAKSSQKQLLSSSIPAPANFLRKRRVSVKPAVASIALSDSSYVSISTPSPAPSYDHSVEDAFTSPRPAPRPPSTIPLLAGDCNSNCNRTGSLSQSEWAIPPFSQLNHAASLSIFTENGDRILFGSIFAQRRTIVIFIRHFWCPLCQDYMSSLSSLVKPEMLQSNKDSIKEVQLVVISNGAHAMIGKYRKIFELPFTMYTDPSLAIYTALGMGRDKGGHAREHGRRHHGSISDGLALGAHEYIEEQETSGDGDYVKHGLIGGIAMVVVRAFKVGMPVWEKGGDIGQLGGEFVFGPGLTCSYAHRMQNTKGHAPIKDVLNAAGIVLPPLQPHQEGWKAHTKKRSSKQSIRRLSVRRSSTSKNGTIRRDSLDTLAARRVSEQCWMDNRQKSLELLRERKNRRRGHGCAVGLYESTSSGVSGHSDERFEDSTRQ